MPARNSRLLIRADSETRCYAEKSIQINNIDWKTVVNVLLFYSMKRAALVFCCYWDLCDFLILRINV